jgi:hypothetical protein
MSGGSKVACLVVASITLAVLAFADIVGLARITEGINKRDPARIDVESVAWPTQTEHAKLLPSSKDLTSTHFSAPQMDISDRSELEIKSARTAIRQQSMAYYEATPERVWQTTGIVPGTSRRAILYLVSNSTKERKRAATEYPPDSQVCH